MVEVISHLHVLILLDKVTRLRHKLPMNPKKVADKSV